MSCQGGLRSFRAIAWLTLILGVVASSGASAWASERVAGRMAEWVPSDVVLFGSIDVQRAVRDWRALDLAELYHDEEVLDFLEPAIDWLRPRLWLEKGAFRMLGEYGLPQILDGHVTLAVYGLGSARPDGADTTWYSASALAEQGMPDEFVTIDAVLAIDTRRVAFDAALSRLLEIDPEVETQEVTSDSIGKKIERARVTRFPLGPWGPWISIYHGFVGDTFVAATRQNRLAAFVASLGGEPVPGALAADESFQAWREPVVRGVELLELFVPVAPASGMLQGEISSFERSLLTNLGIDRARAVGVAIAMEAGRVRESAALILPNPRPGFFGILDACRPSAAIAEGLTGDATAALALRVDPAALFDRFEGALSDGDRGSFKSEVSNLSTEIGVDVRGELLASLGSELTIVTRLPRSGFIPEVIGTVALNDVARFRGAFDGLLRSLPKLSRGQIEVSELALPERDEPGHYLSIRGAPVTPSFMVEEQRLVFTTSPATLRRLAGASRPKASLAIGSTDFARCVATTVGQGMKDVTGLLYVDLATAAEFGLGYAGFFLPMVQSELPFPLDSSLLPLPDTVASYLSGLLATVRVTEYGVIWDCSSPSGGLILPGLIAAWFGETSRIR